MHRILIIEDEEAAAKRLRKMVAEMLPDATIASCISTVQEAITWINANEQPDLAFVDIHLADGSSFEIFKQVPVTCPVIFTTAFDQYALEAFRVNSLDYLLKPIRKEELRRAIDKFLALYPRQVPEGYQHFVEALQQKPGYKERFVVRFGEHMKTILVSDIAYICSENRISFAVLKEGRRFALDQNMDQLERILDPKAFFRINRQYIIGFSAIQEMFTHSKSRVLLRLMPPAKDETIVSAERSAAFKLWLSGD